MGRNNIFQKRHYVEEWRSGKLIGVTKQFVRDLKYSRQRITRGFSDADTWNIDSWFLRTMAEMLPYYKEHRHGSPGQLGENVVDERGFVVNETCHAEWDKILDQMIHLLKEADEETTSAKNACEEEYDRATADFSDQYGTFGERLENADQNRRNDQSASRAKTYHSMTEIPEYKEIWERYRAEEDRIFAYRDRCKDDFLDLFKKWFWAMWD